MKDIGCLLTDRGRMAVRGLVVSAVRVQAVAGNIVLCSWTKHFTLTLALSIQVYKLVPACTGHARLASLAHLLRASHVEFVLALADIFLAIPQSGACSQARTNHAMPNK